MSFVMVGKEAVLYYKNGKRERVKDLRAKLVWLFVQRSGAKGRLLTKDETMKDRKLPDIQDFEAIFGSFENFLAEAEKKWNETFRKVTLQNGKEIVTKDYRGTMFEIALKRALEVGHPIDLDEAFSDKELPFPVDYIEEWGSFEEFFAELTTEWKKKYYDEEMDAMSRKAKFSQEQMIQKLVQIAQKVKRLPGYNDIMAEPGVPTVAMYNSQFGNMKKAYIAAKLTDEEGNKNWDLINGSEGKTEVQVALEEAPVNEVEVDKKEAPREEVEAVVSGEEIPAEHTETTEPLADEPEVVKSGDIVMFQGKEYERAGASEEVETEVTEEKPGSSVKLVDWWSRAVGMKLLIEFEDGTMAELPEPEPGVIYLVNNEIWDFAEKLGRTTDDFVVPAIKANGLWWYREK